MLYDYECSNCNHQLKDVYQSIKDDALTLCPSCNTNNLNRIIYGGLGSFMKDAKTIGQLADHNWSKLGHYQKSELESNKKSEENKNQTAYGGTATKKELNRMTQQQRERYIITGEK
jgi:putative FmdB family regulatory protein